MVIGEKDRKNKYKKFKKYIENKDAIIETEPINELEEAFIKSFNEKNIKKRDFANYLKIKDVLIQIYHANYLCVNM